MHINIYPPPQVPNGIIDEYGQDGWMDPPVDKKSYLLELFTKTGEAKVQGVLKHIGEWGWDLSLSDLLIEYDDLLKIGLYDL
jgi:hypothetical protein